jgi:hypothetical protein
MEYDGYQLYELLKNGDETTLTRQGLTYKLRFKGTPIGSNNYLAVTNEDGEVKRFGWGWGSEQVWRALQHLDQGWTTPQKPPYRAYNERTEVEGGVAY